jgi:hypothetical protein
MRAAALPLLRLFAPEAKPPEPPPDMAPRGVVFVDRRGSAASDVFEHPVHERTFPVRLASALARLG